MTDAPFEIFETEDSTITIDRNCSKIVLNTGNKRIIPNFNEYLTDSNRCSLAETPCGGYKNSNVSDLMPGAVSISGEGCYLKTVLGTYTGKSLGAGKLSENKDIVTSGAAGHSLYTADGEEVLTADGQSVLVTPPYMIVSEFYVQNISETATTATINIRCPDSVSLLQLYNICTAEYESVTFTQVTQTSGTVNSYSFTRSIPAKTEVHLQIMVTYSSLDFTFKFSNDATQASGLQNVESWLAYYDSGDTDINFIMFSKLPDSITCNINSSGNVTQISFPKGTDRMYRGVINDISSLPEFLKGFSSVSSSTATITSYVVPAISDDKILPKSSISSSYISSTLSKRMSPGEYSCLSFVLNSDKNVNLSIIPSNLTNGTNTIPQENIKLKYVKCWWVGGNSKKSTHKAGRYLTPDLLVNDDSLIQAWGDTWNRDDISNPVGKNYLKLNNGEYIHVSDGSNPTPGVFDIIPFSERPVYDANHLQVLNLQSAYNKQVWVTIHVPSGTASGTYSGTITIRSDFIVLKTLTLSITVLPITLQQPSKEYALYYRSRLKTTGSISSEDKNEEQYLAELKDMAEHGVTNPACYQVPSDSLLPQVLYMRQQYFPNSSKLYMFGRIIRNITVAMMTTLKTEGAKYGISKVYIYGIDESNMDEDYRDEIQTVHDNGCYVWCAQKPEYALAVKDVLDVAIGSSAFTASQITEFKTSGHKIYSYGNPQTAITYPRVYRQNYGLFLWQMGYDGCCPYVYQASGNDIYNDFDEDVYRDHFFTLPTVNGVIDTLRFEGFREAANDIRYLEALQAAITAHPGSTATTANNWLTTLKSTDLNTVDLDEVREQMITYILALQGA